MLKRPSVVHPSRTRAAVSLVALLIAGAASMPGLSDASSGDVQRLLYEAPVLAMGRAAPVLELLDELERVLGKHPQGQRVARRLRHRLRRTLKLALTAEGLASAGVDPGRPIWAAFGAHDPQPIRKLHQRLRRSLQRLRQASGKARAATLAKLGRAAAASPAVVRSRLVLAVNDPARLTGYLRRLIPPLPPAGAARTKLLGRWAEPAAARLLADGVDAETGAGGKVLALARPDPALWLLARLVRRPVQRPVRRKAGLVLVVDLVQSWFAGKGKLDEAGARRLLGAVALVPRAAKARGRASRKRQRDLSALRQRAFDRAAGAAVLLRAAELQQLAELQVEREVFQAVGRYASSPEMSREAGRTIDKCLRAWRGGRALTGDTALRIALSKRSLHLRAWWSMPRPIQRALSRAVLTGPEPIDPTAFASALALGGTRIDLGLLARAIGRGTFGQRARRFADAVESCQPVATGVLATGGWLGILGVALAEVRSEPVLAPMAAQLRAVVGVLRSLPTTRRFGRFSYRRPGSAVAHLQLKGGGRARAKVEMMAAKAAIKPRQFAAHGRKTAIYRGMKGLGPMALGLTDLGDQRLGVTLGSRPRDLRWFLGQKPPTRAILPRSILAFGHVNLPALLGHLAGTMSPVARQVAGPMLEALADRIGRLGLNLSLDDGRLAAEVRLDRK